MRDTSGNRAVREGLKWLLVVVTIAVVGIFVFPEDSLVATARLGWTLPARILLAAGADPGRCTSGGENALTMASLRGRYGVIELIVETDHSLDSTDARGKTALRLAIEMERDDIERLLTAAKREGRDRRAPSGCGRTDARSENDVDR